MSRKGNFLDNTTAENFFSKVYNDWTGDDPEQFTHDLADYINWCNTRRLKNVWTGTAPSRIGSNKPDNSIELLSKKRGHLH